MFGMGEFLGVKLKFLGVGDGVVVLEQLGFVAFVVGFVDFVKFVCA